MDLHLRPRSPEELEGMLRTASSMGYSGVGVFLEGSKGIVKGGEASSLDLVSRVDLRPRNQNELLASLKGLRRRFEVVAVECASKAVARQAAKDHRVDILNFPSSIPARKRIGFDRQEAALASGANCAYEINASDLLNRGPANAAKIISMMGREAENARRQDVPIVASSGAGSSLLMREPRALASLLDLLGIGEEEALEAVSKNPQRIVETNRGKLGPEFVAPGVRRAT